MRHRGRPCLDCGGLIPHPLTRHRSRRCPGYAPLWAGDQRRKLFVNLDGYAAGAPVDREPFVVLGAVTAPGQDVLPWDLQHCSGLGDHRHTGDVGCRVTKDASAAWNAAAPGHWRELHSAVMVRCRREGFRPWLLARVWEKQHRGVLHVHPVLAFTTAAERTGAHVYMRHLAELSGHHGFGFTERKLKPMRARAAAAYLSAYFVTGSKEKATLQQSVMAGDMPRSIVHVSHRLTGETGCTMRRLRQLRFLHVRGWGGLCEGDTFHVLDRYVGHPNGTGITTVEWMEANASP